MRNNDRPSAARRRPPPPEPPAEMSRPPWRTVGRPYAGRTVLPDIGLNQRAAAAAREKNADNGRLPRKHAKRGQEEKWHHEKIISARRVSSPTLASTVDTLPKAEAKPFTDDHRQEEALQVNDRKGSNPATLGIGVSLWLNRFVHRTKAKTPAKRAEDEARRQHAEKVSTRSEVDKAGGVSSSTFSKGARDGKLLPGAEATAADGVRHTWSALRSRLVRAKIQEAFASVKYEVAGKTYTSLRLMGEGGYSKVYEVFDASRQLYALKVVDITHSSENVKADLLREMEYLSNFERSDHVIRLLAHDRVTEEATQESGATDVIYLLLERGECDLTHILSYLEDNARLTPTKLRYYWEQMLEAVQSVHGKRIVHADLKPANFVLVQGHLKLIDFGLAGQLEDGAEHLNRTFVGGTKDYMSPESMACFIIEVMHPIIRSSQYSSLSGRRCELRSYARGEARDQGRLQERRVGAWRHPVPAGLWRRGSFLSPARRQAGQNARSHRSLQACGL